MRDNFLLFFRVKKCQILRLDFKNYFYAQLRNRHEDKYEDIAL
jgi:hypothetical protein